MKKDSKDLCPMKGKEICHVQVVGVAMFDQVEEDRFVKFEPEVETPGLMTPLKRRAVIVQGSDGEFEVVIKPSYHSHAKQIVKLPHGRLSETKDGAYQLTLKVYMDEGVDAARCFKEEALMAAGEMRKM